MDTLCWDRVLRNQEFEVSVMLYETSRRTCVALEWLTYIWQTLCADSVYLKPDQGTSKRPPRLNVLFIETFHGK